MKKIKKITLEIWDDLLNRVDEAAIKDGFNSRSEFLRFLIVT
ncbi:ribbon-helix-helix protein, CopG family [Patescibacteria group bacterium]|nr:ribbon-helix-helix protein, CopG family [Patescibacteria group bacterium]MBU1015729.1 ribbon-helix-helix protein, CopG family [Patescibacteria group bacterium]MBU1684901.1 ribbon-helix-helix protein, CopG family [Patescibacteria group bacterium]MBU1938641.1 ribbon-helix-helix protein, CopG family [Patescibacteria group bacterium]